MLKKRELGAEPATNQWNAAHYDAKHAFVYEKAKGLVELLAPQPGERILDLGCGTGALTAEIAASGADVLGVDRSGEMIAQARTKFPALRFERLDARELRVHSEQIDGRTWSGTGTGAKLKGANKISNADRVEQRSGQVGWLGFDAVFSNAVLHWIPEAEEVIAGVARVLKPGGRFVVEFGGRGNIQKLVRGFQKAFATLGMQEPDGVSPWFYPSVAEYAGMLARHGLEVHQASLFDRPTVLEEGENGLENWIRVFRQTFLEKMGEAKARQWIREVERQCRSELFHDGSWVLDYRRLRIAAWKTEEKS